PLAVALDEVEHRVEVAEVALQLDVVLAGPQDAVVSPLDQNLRRAGRARLEVTRGDREVCDPAILAGEAGLLPLLEARVRMLCRVASGTGLKCAVGIVHAATPFDADRVPARGQEAVPSIS